MFKVSEIGGILVSIMYEFTHQAEIRSLSDEAISAAAKALMKGLLVAFPTETVYGLGADAFNGAALARIFEVKERPRFDPLIVHIAGIDALERVADLAALDQAAREHVDALIQRLWPGPLTLILPKQPSIPDLATAGLPTVAVRFPDHPAAQQLIRRSSGAIAAPSANRFGCLSPTRAEHVQEQLGDRIAMILDGGRTGIGVESTVLDLSSCRPRILRPGGTSRECIEAVIGAVHTESLQLSDPCSPGQLKSHYAPRTVLTLHHREEMIVLPYGESEGYLFFDGKSRDAWYRASKPGDAPWIRTLSETGNMTEAAANFFDLLHELDKSGCSAIRGEQAPEEGLGSAINDRLSRAAAAK
ncbi:MAG: threonylcarbamoyl-AMP synthase [Treponema sp.]|jgi:L-threonylcarbamoyladenylate synthase|nr:threonylcarbamoyl-AMP synthase [Treponema sp.]